MRRAAVFGFAFAALLVPFPAHAHLVDVRFGDFYGGALHVLTGLEYGLLLIALSLLAALQSRETGRWMLGAVPLGMAVGGAAAAASSAGSIAIVVTAILCAVAVLVALGRQLPVWALVSIGLLAAALLGFENGLAMTEQSTVYLFVFGLAAAALLAVTLVTAGTVQLAEARPWMRPWARIALRAVGSWIAAVSLILIALAVAGPIQAA